MSNSIKHNDSFLSSVGNVFPPPSFMSFPRAVFFVGPGIIRYLSIKSSSLIRGIQLFGSFPTQLSDVDDFSDEIRTTIKVVVGDFLARKGHKHSTLIFPEKDVYLFRVFLPKMKHSEIRSAVELRIEENIPVSAADVVFEFDIVHETERGILVAVSAVPRRSLDRLVANVSDSGLLVVAVETEARALARTFTGNGLSSSLIIFIGETDTVCVVASCGVALFSSTISLSSVLFRKALSETFSISLEKADQFRDESVSAGHMSDSVVVAKLAPEIKILRDELSKIIEYWSVHAQAEGVPPVEKIILSGSNSSLPSFVQHVAAGFKIPVEVGNVWSMVAEQGGIIDISKTQSLDYAVLIGALIKR
jgi:Tfp pilus assembly PilM family ATPase